MGALPSDQIFALLAASFLLMMAWRNIARRGLGWRRAAGFALIWLAIFMVGVVLAGLFVG